MATTATYDYRNLSKDVRAASSRRLDSSPKRGAFQKSQSFKAPSSSAAPRRMPDLTDNQRVSIRGKSKSNMKRAKSSPSMADEGKRSSSKTTKKGSTRAVSPVRRTKSGGVNHSPPRKPAGRNRAARLLARQGGYGAEMAAKNLGKFSAEEFKYEPSAAELMYEELYRPPTRFIGMAPDVENSTDAGIFITSKSDLPKELKPSSRPKLGKLLSFKKSKSKGDDEAPRTHAHAQNSDPDTQAFYVGIDE